MAHYWPCIFITINSIIQILCPRLLFPCNAHSHCKPNCEVSIPVQHINGVSTFFYPSVQPEGDLLSPKHVAESNRTKLLWFDWIYLNFKHINMFERKCPVSSRYNTRCILFTTVLGGDNRLIIQGHRKRWTGFETAIT